MKLGPGLDELSEYNNNNLQASISHSPKLITKEALARKRRVLDLKFQSLRLPASVQKVLQLMKPTTPSIPTKNSVELAENDAKETLRVRNID